MKILLACLLSCFPLLAQAVVPATRWRIDRIDALANIPATCIAPSAGVVHVFVCSGAGCTSGARIYLCTATNTWVNQGVDLSAPGEIGGATPAPGNFTTLDATPGGTVSALKSYSYTYTNAAFLAASTTAMITVVTLPANTVVDKVYLKHSTAIAGTGITAATCSLGVAGDTDFYLAPADVFVAPTATLNYSMGNVRQYSTASHDLILTCVANTNWGDGVATTVLTAGSLTVAVAYSTIIQ